MRPYRENSVTHANITGAGEELSEAVERARHNTVGRVEGLLDTVTVVDVDVNVEHTGVDAQKFENTENAITSARLLCLPPTCR